MSRGRVGRGASGLGVVLLTVLAGCGYGFVGAGVTDAPDARTIEIALFENETRERGLEVALRRALEEEFRRRSGLRVVGREGDLRLSGSIRRLGTVPIAFTGASEAVEFQSRMVVAVRLVERRGDRVLFRAPHVVETTDFAGVRDVVISSSPAFQLETADASDLAHLSSVTFTESNRRRATARLIGEMAAQVYLLAMEAF